MMQSGIVRSTDRMVHPAVFFLQKIVEKSRAKVLSASLHDGRFKSMTSNMVTKIQSRQAPPVVKKWLEKQLDRKVLTTEEITIWTTKKLTKKEREQHQSKWEAERARRKHRLERIARKMLQAGMSNGDADVVRRGGWTN